MKVSIIIPIYNKEKYLSRCLNSIIKQSYRNIEIICINDGSTDSSSDIVKEYQSKDKRIILVEQENKGVGIARNKGIEISIGKYILFVDADDALEINAVETYLKYSNFDLVIGGFCEITEMGERKENIPKKSTFKTNDFTKIICEYNKYILIVWNKLFSCEIIKKNKIFFNNSQYGEDTYFVYKYLKYSNNIFILNKSLYVNYLVTNSLSRNKNYNIEKIWLEMKEILEEGKKISLKDNKLESFLFLRNMKTILLLSVISDYSLKNFFYIVEEIKKDFPKVVIKEEISIYEKLILFLIKNKLFILLYILLIIRKGILKIK